MAVSRFLVGGLASALLLTGGVFIWKGYSQVAEEAVLPDPPPALPAIPVAGASAPKRGAAPPALPTAKAESREERSEEHTSELQSLMRISYAVFCLTQKNKKTYNNRLNGA